MLETVKTELLYLWSKLTGAKKRSRKAAFDAFDAALARLRPGDLVIDLGANVGIYTEKFAATGADVIAFEPDPHAFSLLQKRVGALGNVRLIPAAAGGVADRLKLFRRADFQASPDARTTSSSLFSEKHKMDKDQFVEVDVIDFPKFLADLGRDVTLLKMDIEGAEVPLMEALLASPQAARIGLIFIESHERVVRSLAGRTRALKDRTRALTRPRVNWDWH